MARRALPLQPSLARQAVFVGLPQHTARGEVDDVVIENLVGTKARFDQFQVHGHLYDGLGPNVAVADRVAFRGGGWA